jgi:hypothetical protein
MVSMAECCTKATVKGVEREPGQIIAVVKPKRYNVSTSTEAQTVLMLRKSIIESIKID